MRMFWLSLTLACLCTLSPCLTAAEYQPNTQEWYELIKLAERTKGYYHNLALWTQQRVDDVRKHPHPPVAVIGSPIDERPTLEMLAALLVRVKKTEADLGALLAELKGLKADKRSRAEYVRFLRPVRQAAYQYTLDEPQLYQVDARTRIDISALEAEIKAIRAARPERIDPAQPPKGLQISLSTFPRLDGSTTAQPLSTLLACRLLGLGAEWHMRQLYDVRNSEGTQERILIPVCGETPLLVKPNIVVPGGVAPMQVRHHPEENVGFPGLRMNMAHSGTSTAYCNLIAGAADLIIVARPPSPDETALAQEKQVELELCPVGYDAFIFLLHCENPVNSLTVKQIQDIYTDNVLNWSEVGGERLRVVAFQRERNSGSQETMASLVMPGLEMAPPLEMLIGYGMGGPYNRMYHQKNGISYTFYYYHTVQSPENPSILARKEQEPVLKMCAVNGVTPSAETIRNRTYPFISEVYAVVRKDLPADSSAIRLRDWLLTPEGQAVVKESGYVPLPE